MIVFVVVLGAGKTDDHPVIEKKLIGPDPARLVALVPDTGILKGDYPVFPEAGDNRFLNPSGER
jgi:hypothetical protein